MRRGPEATSAVRLQLPRLMIENGTIEALKWLALVLMTLDHVNKYLLHDAVPLLFNAGRLAAPLFLFVLSFNLARPGRYAEGAYGRVMQRLAFFGLLASVPFTALGGLGWGWWPLNIMVMMLVATIILYLVEAGGAGCMALAVGLFVVGGAVVEFWWPALVVCIAAWRYCKSPSWASLGAWCAGMFSLGIINRNQWALLALGIIFLAPFVSLRVPRLSRLFYVYYPAHLSALWALAHLTQS